MKISKLNIDSYKHLQNLNFDFTYPEGHEKGSKPLNKICIIGQSATGKTSLLELIKKTITKLDALEITEENTLTEKSVLEFYGEVNLLLNNIDVIITNTTVIIDDINFEHNSKVDAFLTSKLIDNKR